MKRSRSRGASAAAAVGSKPSRRATAKAAPPPSEGGSDDELSGAGGVAAAHPLVAAFLYENGALGVAYYDAEQGASVPGALRALPCVAPRCNLSPRARLFPPLPQRRCTWRARGAWLARLRGWRASSSSSWPRASQRCA